MRAIDAIREKETLARRTMTIDEWGVTLWVTKLTVGDIESVRALAPDSEGDQNIHMLIRKCENEDGTPLFSSGDFDALKYKIDGVVLMRVVNFVYTTIYQSIDAAKKALDQDPQPASVTS